MHTTHVRADPVSITAFVKVWITQSFFAIVQLERRETSAKKVSKKPKGIFDLSKMCLNNYKIFIYQNVQNQFLNKLPNQK